MMHTSTIGHVIDALLEKYPAADAEAWDKTGLILGDAQAPVTGVVVALDPTIEALSYAVSKQANVLITHHPPFLKAPETFLPAQSIADEPGALVYAAASAGVALACFHTAFDNSEDALHVLPQALGLKVQRTLLPLDAAKPQGKGYGALCCAASEFASVAELARACQAAFGGSPRIWGDPNAPVSYVVTAQGSAAEAGYAALRQEGVTCLVCGELKYHDALPLSQAGLPIIELGHDKSELLLARRLAQTVRELNIVPVDELVQNNNWTCL